jgi:OOP family OmpA-OmpF porin
MTPLKNKQLRGFPAEVETASMKGYLKMKRDFCGLTLFLCALCFPLFPAAGFAQDCEGCKDPALFSRMTGFHIYNATILEFDSYEFWVNSSKTEKVEGRHSSYDYYANEGIKLPSGLQIVRNYTNAAKAIGGIVVYEYEDGGTQYAVIKIAKDGKEIWARVEGANNGIYKLQIVEKQAMNQDVVADAKFLAGSINTTGKAAVYGIYFDTNKSVIKPESEPAIAQIAKMLQSDPTLKIYVVGHTDNVGVFDYNVKLSQERAAAVIAALTKLGISAARLTPFGAGPTSPVASNKSEDGRAKNRRVELVAQ